MFFDVIILLINVLWDIRMSIKFPKKLSGVIRRNCRQKSSFWWHTLDKAKIEVQKDPKNVQN